MLLTFQWIVRFSFPITSDAIVETILLVLVILSLMDVINDVEDSGFALFTFGVLLVIEKAITVYHSNRFIKEFIPRDKKIRPLA